jgi:hypothetical protein
MEARLTFQLPEEDADFQRASRADGLCSFIWDFQQYLREQWKYADTPDDINTIYEKWFEYLNENNIDLDRLYP